MAIRKHELESPAKKPLPATEANVLHRRRDRIIEWERIDCGPGPNQWDPADIEQIAMGIQYLSGLAGKPGNGPGPGNCGRVSCSWGASIWWCNDVSISNLPSSLHVTVDRADCTFLLECYTVSTGRMGGYRGRCQEDFREMYGSQFRGAWPGFRKG